MPENILLSKFISTIDPVIVDKEKEQFLLWEFHRTSEANTELPYLLSMLSHGQ